jgi:hypothetical protein
MRGPDRLRFAIVARYDRGQIRASWQDGEGATSRVLLVAVEVVTTAEVGCREAASANLNGGCAGQARLQQLQLEREERERQQRLEQARIDRVLDEAESLRRPTNIPSLSMLLPCKRLSRTNCSNFGGGNAAVVEMGARKIAVVYLACVQKCTDATVFSCSNTGTSSGSDPMAEYRAYIIGGDGHFLRVVELLCPDDDTAKECAKQFADGHDVELWQGERKITAFKHSPE